VVNKRNQPPRKKNGLAGATISPSATFADIALENEGLAACRRSRNVAVYPANHDTENKVNDRIECYAKQ
jgi:hypothetical protein